MLHCETLGAGVEGVGVLEVAEAGGLAGPGDVVVVVVVVVDVVVVVKHSVLNVSDIV